MRVLAVDPGLTRCGLAVVETGSDGRTRALVAEVIRTEPDTEAGGGVALDARVRRGDGAKEGDAAVEYDGEPRCEGLAISLRYEVGVLVRAATRASSSSFA